MNPNEENWKKPEFRNAMVEKIKTMTYKPGVRPPKCVELEAFMFRKSSSEEQYVRFINLTIHFHRQLNNEDAWQSFAHRQVATKRLTDEIANSPRDIGRTPREIENEIFAAATSKSQYQRLLHVWILRIRSVNRDCTLGRGA